MQVSFHESHVTLDFFSFLSSAAVSERFLLVQFCIYYSLEECTHAAAGEAATEEAEDRASAAGYQAEAAEVRSMAAGRAAAS